jgi:glycosyltransferase involved in cell wall biosynthesis
MRILYLNPFSQEVSGPDESLLALLPGLHRAGIEAHVVLPAPGPQVDRYRAVNAAVHFLPLAPLRRDLSLATATYPARLLRSAARIRQLARQVGADLIHTNMEVLLEGGLAARSLRIPHVMHYRGNTFDRPAWVFDLLTATWTRLADQIFCISRATAAVFGRRKRMQKVEVLYNPIDVARFSAAARSPDVRASLGLPGPGRLIGTVGRIHPRKDLDTFLRAAAQVAQAEPDTHFVIVGVAEADVERAYQRQLHHLIRELAIEQRVTFAGTRRDIPEVMAALDVFVLSARHEGFGRVVGEAMAAGRPVVVTDEGALPELVEGGQYGLCAPPGDAGEFARRIQHVLANPEAAAAMAARAAQRAHVFEARAAAERVKTCYERLLAGT